jgi:hypothetical protein
MEAVDGWRMVDGLVIESEHWRNRDEAEEWELAAFKGIRKLSMGDLAPTSHSST